MLVIYDISSNRRRNKLSKLLLGYGERVQESAFEAIMTNGEYRKLLAKVSRMVERDVDSVRIYRITDRAGAFMIGKNIVVDPARHAVI